MPVLVDSVDVTLAGWNDMVDALKSIERNAQNECVDCGSGGVATSTHSIHHTTFAFRFAPPWFNADQRSLFTSYVVFPEEAKFDDWIDRPPGESCTQEAEKTQSSVCPETAFYKKAMQPFLTGLSRCATDKKVELQTLGFTSSTTLRGPARSGGELDELKERYGRHIDAITGKVGGCRGQVNDAEDDISSMFNLLIANERAVNAAAMLRGLVPIDSKDAFDIRAIPWCSHASMVAERSHEDEGDVAKGLMNRRVEVHLVSLPGCLNVDPDRRIDVTG